MALPRVQGMRTTELRWATVVKNNWAVVLDLEKILVLKVKVSLPLMVVVGATNQGYCLLKRMDVIVGEEGDAVDDDLVDGGCDLRRDHIYMIFPIRLLLWIESEEALERVHPRSDSQKVEQRDPQVGIDHQSLTEKFVR
ncbi:hypothetical protein U1Q18_010836 [Sarracenia purpurea var. burkii]